MLSGSAFLLSRGRVLYNIDANKLVCVELWPHNCFVSYPLVGQYNNCGPKVCPGRQRVIMADGPAMSTTGKVEIGHARITAERNAL